MAQTHPKQCDFIKEIYVTLLKGSRRTIPFNIAVSSVLITDLYHYGVSTTLLSLWYGGVVLISVFRWHYSKKELNNIPDAVATIKLYFFCFLVFLASLLWGAAYFIFTPHVNLVQELIIILVLGGLAAGAVATLCIFLPAYYCYIIPMFLPIILYNFYTLHFDRIILAWMCVLFILMLMVSAKINAHILHDNIHVTKENQWLIKKLSHMNSSLKTTNEQLVDSIEEVRTLSITDQLTGLYNRRHFSNHLKNEIDRARRAKQTIHLVLVDVDNFKYINDTYGHPIGDEFLIKTANALKQALRRANDVVYRLGGDEFAAILLNLTNKEAKNLCLKIQDEFKTSIKNEKVSLSIGMLSISANANTMDIADIIAHADKALYQAKHEGRNCIVVLQL